MCVTLNGFCHLLNLKNDTFQQLFKSSETDNFTLKDQ